MRGIEEAEEGEEEEGESLKEFPLSELRKEEFPNQGAPDFVFSRHVRRKMANNFEI